MVTATKVVGEHSHPNLRGWEGSLTKEMGKTLVIRGNHFIMTSGVRGKHRCSRNPNLIQSIQ
jgi:hypothetical protein